jgi:hypothetical protein
MRSKIFRSLLVVLVNLMVFSALLLLSELAARILTVKQSCMSSQCDWSKLAQLKIAEIRFELSHKVGLTTPNAELGWVPTPGFDQIINDANWRHSRLTITSQGFRYNGAITRSGDTTDPNGILVVGDSYAFGDQVSDWETWPSCLERETTIPVYNAGVPGYGAAQAVKRAEILSKTHHYGELIWEILVGHDFERDRLEYKSGFSKPSVIQDSQGVHWSGVSDPTRKGTKYNPDPPGYLVSFAYENLMLAKMLIDTVLHWDMTGMNLTSVHPRAAPKDEVIDLAFANFVRTNPERKSVLLQYKIYGWLQKDVLDERAEILEIADRYGIMVVDTLDALTKYQPAAIWDGHHTALGNEVVCERLMSWRKSEAFARSGR